MKTLKEKIKNGKEMVLYLIFGAGTTLVNIVSYFVLRSFFDANITVATIISWFFSVLFAYVTNKTLVFKSRKADIKGLAVEFLFFISGRFLTCLIELCIMIVFVDHIKLSESLMKIVSSVVVIILNYIFSKVWIFKK